jgi:hypothetical protein
MKAKTANFQDIPHIPHVDYAGGRRALCPIGPSKATPIVTGPTGVRHDGQVAVFGASV